MPLSKEDLEQITALIKADREANPVDLEGLMAPIADQLAVTVQEYIAKAHKEYDDKFAALESNTSDKTTETSEAPAEGSLEARVKLLTDKLEAAETAKAEAAKREQALRFDQHLSGLVDGFKPQYKEVALELLKNRIQDAEEKAGSWLTKDGKTVEETVKGFFDTPEGKHLLPSQHQDGAGTTDTQAKTTQKDTKADLAAIAW